MIKSMTGYGSYELLTEIGLLRVSLRSVNRKGLDIQLTLPSVYRSLEADLSEKIQKRLFRGSIFAEVELEASNSPRANLFDPGQIADFVAQMEQISALSNWPIKDVLLAFGSSASKEIGLFRPKAVPGHEWMKSQLLLVTEKALDQLDLFRLKEGSALILLLLTMIQEMQQLVVLIETSLEGLVDRHTAKIRQRLEQLGVLETHDPNRWQMEVALLADRLDVREELDRLKIHLSHFEQNCVTGHSPIGRKLDFLSQEMMREINTLMNKTQDAQVTPYGIDLKASIERLREQLQNLE